MTVDLGLEFIYNMDNEEMPVNYALLWTYHSPHTAVFCTMHFTHCSTAPCDKFPFLNLPSTFRSFAFYQQRYQTAVIDMLAKMLLACPLHPLRLFYGRQHLQSEMHLGACFCNCATQLIDLVFDWSWFQSIFGSLFAVKCWSSQVLMHSY